MHSLFESICTTCLLLLAALCPCHTSHFLRSVVVVVFRTPSKVAESEVAIAFAEDLQRIDTVATQLMELERRASSVRDRPLDHFCTISHEVMTDPVLTMCGHTFGMSI